MYKRAWKEMVAEINAPIAWWWLLRSIFLHAKDALRHTLTADDILHGFVRSSKSPRGEQRKRSIQAQAMYPSGGIKECDGSFALDRMQPGCSQLVLEPLDSLADLPLDAVILQPVYNSMRLQIDSLCYEGTRRSL